jgi:hypothetical protein
MRTKHLSLSVAIVLLALVAYVGGVQGQGQDDPVVQKIMQLGTTDNR